MESKCKNKDNWEIEWWKSANIWNRGEKIKYIRRRNEMMEKQKSRWQNAQNLISRWQNMSHWKIWQTARYKISNVFRTNNLVFSKEKQVFFLKIQFCLYRSFFKSKFLIFVIFQLARSSSNLLEVRVEKYINCFKGITGRLTNIQINIQIYVKMYCLNGPTNI